MAQTQTNTDKKKDADKEKQELVLLYQQFLTLTEDSLECLKNDDYSQLVELTNQRFKVFQDVSKKNTKLPAEVAGYIKKIIDYENQIIELAKRKKTAIEKEFDTLHNKGKIAKAYCY